MNRSGDVTLLIGGPADVDLDESNPGIAGMSDEPPDIDYGIWLFP